MRIANAGEFGYPKLPFMVNHAGLGACSTERASWCDQHAQPIVALFGGIVFVLLQRAAGMFQFTQSDHGWGSHAIAVVEKRALIIKLEAQGSGAIGVVYTEKKIRFERSEEHTSELQSLRHL